MVATTKHNKSVFNLYLLIFTIGYWGTVGVRITSGVVREPPTPGFSEVEQGFFSAVQKRKIDILVHIGLYGGPIAGVHINVGGVAPITN